MSWDTFNLMRSFADGLRTAQNNVLFPIHTNLEHSVLKSMLDFAARHNIVPQVEHFPMSKINDALNHLAAGKARYRIVLDADFV